MLNKFTKRILIRTLKATNKNKSEAARRLGISRATVIKLCQQFKIS